MREGQYDIVGLSAATLSAVEVGLGSILHGLKVPLAGNLLSLNQAFMLGRAVRAHKDMPGARTLPASISGITACLKSLSPAGKKLGPMLGISAQGLLMSAGTLLLGPNVLGLVLGSVLMSFWAFLQPVLVYYFIFGEGLAQVLDNFLKMLNEVVGIPREGLFTALAILVGLKALLAAGVAILAWKAPPGPVAAYEQKLLAAGRSKRLGTSAPATVPPAMGALKDLLNPLFLVTFALTAVFALYFQGGSAQVVWTLLRPLAVGYFLFLAVRLAPIERWARAGRFPALGRALEFLRGL